MGFDTAVLSTVLGFASADIDVRWRFRGQSAFVPLVAVPPAGPVTIVGVLMLAFLSRIGLFGSIEAVMACHVVSATSFAMGATRPALSWPQPAWPWRARMPWPAVVVRDGQIIGEGLNHSVAHFDPTSHGEVEALRDACRKLQTVNLAGCELYTSCEPCALCVAAMQIAGIGRLFYAASLQQSGEAFAGVSEADRHPIDCDSLRAEAGLPIDKRIMPAEQQQAPEAMAVLKAWAAQRV